jgi:predicted alpha/beta-hydrolase family hydrolase
MTLERDRIEVPDKGAISAVLTPPGGEHRWLFVYAPGASANIDDPFAIFASRELAAAGVGVLRFQFLYKERGRGGPDPNDVLEATWRAVLDRAREHARPQGLRIVIGGRSMGGRIASHIVAAGDEVDALALFAYPLRPPGKPQQRRDEHLARIKVPTLFCSGTRDAFGSAAELQAASGLVAGSRLHLLEGADHGFNVPKSSGRRREDVWRECCDVLTEFLTDLSP